MGLTMCGFVQLFCLFEQVLPFNGIQGHCWDGCHGNKTRSSSNKIQPVVGKLFFALNLTAFGKETVMRRDTHNWVYSTAVVYWFNFVLFLIFMRNHAPLSTWYRSTWTERPRKWPKLQRRSWRKRLITPSRRKERGRGKRRESRRMNLQPPDREKR